MTPDEEEARMTPDEEEALYASLQADGGGLADPSLSAGPSPSSENLAATEGAAPPTGIAPFELPEYGPPAPDPTDALAASMPAPQTGIPTRDTSQDFAPGVPREAPGNIGAPAPLPGMAPAGSPGAAGGPSDGAAPGSTAAVGEALGRAQEARGATAEAQTAFDQGEQERKRAEADAARDRAAAADEHIRRAEEIQKRYDAAETQAAEHVKATQAALKSFKFKDFWADKSSARRVMSKLGVALGAFGAALTHTPNYALQLLNKEMDDDHRAQVDQLNQLKDEDVMAKTGIADARAARGRAMADLTLADAHKDRLIARQLDEAAARSTNDNYKNAVAIHTAKLREEAAAKDIDAHKMLRSMGLEDAEKAAKLDQIKADADMKRAHTAGTGGFARKGKGSGSGAGTGTGVAALSQFIKDHPDDQPGAYNLAQSIVRDPAKAAALVDKLQNDYKTGKAKSEEDEKNTVRAEQHDPSGLAAGTVLGTVPSGKGGAAGFATRDSEYGRAIGQLEALERDIAENGERVLLPSSVKRRESLFKNATIGVGTVSPLGKTDSALHEEKGSIGGTGGSWSLMGANHDAVKEKIHELREQRKRYRDQTLIPLKGETVARSGDGGGAHGATGGDPRIEKARAAVKAGSGATDAQRKNAQAFLDAHGG